MARWMQRFGEVSAVRAAGPGTHTPVVSPDGRHAAVAFSSDDTPPDPFLITLRGEQERRINRSVAWGTSTWSGWASGVRATAAS